MKDHVILKVTQYAYLSSISFPYVINYIVISRRGKSPLLRKLVTRRRRLVRGRRYASWCLIEGRSSLEKALD